MEFGFNCTLFSLCYGVHDETYIPTYLLTFVSDIAIFVLKRDVKLQLTYLLTYLYKQRTSVELRKLLSGPVVTKFVIPVKCRDEQGH